ncbi:MAG: MFS transporter [Elusimicrobiota bacterium]|nr:MFS transporter [Elusimicrobiota bacterium]
MTGSLPPSLRALGRREFRLYFAGQLVSMTGTWMQQTAQGWLIYRLTGSGTLLGVTAAVSQAPSVLLGLAGGAAADRLDRRSLLLWTQALALAQAAVLAALTSAGAVTVTHVLILSFLLGVVNAFDMPARQSFVPQLVPPEDAGNAIALSGVLLNASRVVGPALAGAVIAAAGEAACFWFNAASYAAMLASLACIAARPAAARTEASALAHIREGLDYAWRDPERRSLLALLAAVSFAGMPLFSILPAFTEGALKAGPRGMGLLMGAVGVGALFASVRLARRADAEGLPRALGLGAAAFGAALALMGFAPSLPWAMAVAALAGYGMMTAFSGGNIRLQTRSDDAHRGRLMSLFTMSFMATAPFGALASGWAADRFGPRAAVTGGGLLVAAVAAGFLRTRAGDGRR